MERKEQKKIVERIGRRGQGAARSKKQMKTWFDDIVYSLQRAGGVSVMWSHITKGVPFQCSHIRYEGSEENAFSEKIEGHHYEMRSNRFLNLKRYINPRIDEKEPFLFHSSYYRYCPSKNAINITTVHDFIYELYDHRLIANLHKWQKRRAVMHSDAVICVSENTKKDLLNFYPEYKGLIKVVNNGYDSGSYYCDGRENKEKIILTVGGRGRHKRFDLTVQIVKTLKDCKLVIVGGEKLTDTEKALLKKEVPGRYEEAGYLSNDQLRELLNRAFFLSYPSDYEGFGIPAIEAQACGCPVVCQAKGSLPEVVGDAAVYLDPNDVEDSIKKLYDKDFYRDIVRRGLENVKRFSWDKCREETHTFYREVLREL